MKDADLVNLPAAVCALNERLDLQDVVLRRLELRLRDVPAFGGLDFRCFLICVPSVTLFLNQPLLNCKFTFKDKKESQRRSKLLPEGRKICD